MNRTNTLISTLTGVLVFLLAAAAFLLSFDALKHLAATNGIPAGKSWIYPAIVDGAIIVFSLSVLQASLNRQRTAYPWVLVAVFTMMSVILNIVHAPNSFLSRVLAAIPPVALFLSFELLMGQIKGLVQRSGLVQSLQELEQIVRTRTTELDALIQQKQTEARLFIEKAQKDMVAWKQQQVADLEKTLSVQAAEFQTQIDTWTAEVNRLENRHRTLEQNIVRLEARKGDLLDTNSSGAAARTKRATAVQPDGELVTPSDSDASPVSTANKLDALDRLLLYLASNPYASLTEMGEAIGRSKSTAGSYVSELTSSGRLHQNGHGWEVLTL